MECAEGEEAEDPGNSQNDSEAKRSVDLHVGDARVTGNDLVCSEGLAQHAGH